MKYNQNEPYTIMCYGDSNTYGYNPSTTLRYGRDERWTQILAKRLGPNYNVLEFGCNGRTAFAKSTAEPWKHGLYGLEPALNSSKPVHLMIVMLGTNDLKNFFNVSPADIAGGVEAIIDLAKAVLKEKQGFEPEILLISPTGLGQGMIDGTSVFANTFDQGSYDKALQFPTVFGALATKLGCAYMDASKIIDPSPVDSLHLSAAAHQKLGNAIYEKVSLMVY